MLSLLGKFKQSSIVSGTSILALGGLLSAFLSSIFAAGYPFWYGPEEIGRGAFLLSIASLILPLCTMRLEYSIVTSKSDIDAGTVTFLGFLLSLLVAISFIPILYLGKTWGIEQLNNVDVILLPCLLVFSVANILINFVHTREKNFSQITLNQSILALLRGGMITVLGVIGCYNGYFIGSLFGLAIISIYYVIQIKKSRLYTQHTVNLKKIRDSISENKKLIIHTLSTSFANGLGAQALPICFSIQYDYSAVGIFFILQQWISRPISLISKAFWRTVFAELSTSSAPLQRERVKNCFVFSALILLIPLCFFSLLLPKVTYLLPEGWESIAELVPFFFFMVYFNTVANCSSYFVTFSEYVAESVWNVILLSIKLLGVLFLSNLLDSPTTALKVYCLIVALSYIFLAGFWAIKLDFVINFFVILVLCVLPSWLLTFFANTLFINAEFESALVILVVCLISIYVQIRKQMKEDAK